MKTEDRDRPARSRIWRPAAAMCLFLGLCLAAAPHDAARADTTSPTPSPSTTQPDTESGGAADDQMGSRPIMIVMDLSSSMGEEDGAGVVKLEGAKTALTRVVYDLPRAAYTGLLTYPSDGDCGAGRVLSTVAPLDTGRLTAEIQKMQPNGNTPTALALKLAVERIKSAGFSTGTILLVSDGEANCDADPCDAAEEIAASGFDVTVEATGFQMSEEGRAQLQCIATATGGSYQDVSDTDQLSQRLQEVAGPQLNLDVTGNKGSVLGGSRVTITAKVTNSSNSVTAADVLLSLAFLSDSPDAVLPPVLPPRIRLGNIPPGGSVTRSWKLAVGRAGQFATAKSLITLQAKNADPILASGTWAVSGAAPSVSEAGPLLKNAKRVMIIGDSYSAGEGTGKYDTATDNKLNNCHRSSMTYALAAYGITSTDPIVACSGAVTAEYQTGKTTGVNVLGTGLNLLLHPLFSPPTPDVSWAMPPQSEAVRSIVTDPKRSPDVVFMTFGGNDIGFANIIAQCASPQHPGDCTNDKVKIANDAAESCRNPGADRVACKSNGEKWTTFTLRQVGAIQPVLTELYWDVLTDINSSVARKARGGRTVPLIVLAYPQVITATKGDGCANLNNNERSFGVQVVRQLNNSVGAAVEAVSAKGQPIFFATPVSEAVLPNHTACADRDADRWINPISIVQGAVGLAGGGANRSEQELMHPTKDGYAAETTALLQWSTTMPALSPAQQATAVPPEPGLWLQVDETVQSRVTDLKFVDLDMNTDLSAKPASIPAPGNVVVHVSGLAPSSQVRVVLNSQPVTLGTFTADAAGTVSAAVRVPASTRRGQHHIDTIGTNTTGQPVLNRRSIDIYVPLPWWLWAVLVLSTVSLLAAAGIAIRIRKDSQASKTSEATI